MVTAETQNFDLNALLLPLGPAPVALFNAFSVSDITDYTLSESLSAAYPDDDEKAEDDEDEDDDFDEDEDFEDDEEDDDDDDEDEDDDEEPTYQVYDDDDDEDEDEDE
ncbi:MAG TPA: hypothetical protein VIX42_11930 [Edaphobacter sp.]